MQLEGNRSIRAINQTIRDHKYTVEQNHDYFDPSGSVQWGDECTSGFLTKCETGPFKQQELKRK